MTNRWKSVDQQYLTPNITKLTEVLLYYLFSDQICAPIFYNANTKDLQTNSLHIATLASSQL